MGRIRLRRSLRLPLVAAAVFTVLVFLSSGTSAKITLRSPTPSPTASPTPALTPPPETTPTPQPIPTAIPVPDPEQPTPKPDEETDGGEDGKADGADGVDKGPAGDIKDQLGDKLPDALEEELVVPVFPRTRARNTASLVAALQPLTELGYPLDQVLVEGMGRFPVAGLAYYSDDWLNPRYTPKPHLHHGLDIFADFGTPIRSPDRGVVSRLSTGGSGGVGVWVRGQDGTSYYFAHLLERAEGLHVGQRVQVGTVIGYVGDTGNAQGGTPHLHFQIHPGGGAPVPPKPSVDAWLDEAEQIAPRWADAKRQEFEARGKKTTRTPATIKKREEIETSMLLTLLDPIGGSVGMLPSLEVEPRRSGMVSDRLLDELVRQRVQGRLFIPSSGIHLKD
jgi:murein DD-endopeptidase MepM/ murein hydrolase activator NlpD